VALDRQSIEKKDFPVGRRGYEPEAVDAHLSAIATKVEELKRSSGKSSGSLATSAGEQVRAIVDAAETTATQIRADAEQEAERTLTDARKELEAAREQAATVAAAEVKKLSDATAALLSRITAMEQEVGGLVESLRSGATRLGDELRSLESGLGELEPSGAVVATEQPGPAPAQAEAPTPAAEEAESAPEPKVKAEPAAAAAAGGDEDLEGARLIALNMALNGDSREDTDRYLEENFDLADRKALLDEVYASVEG
jgi:F0F1-type ATP synthase membrane subunit b/b'